MTSIRIAAATTDDDLRSFLAVVEAVHPGSGATPALLRHELDTQRETVFLVASLGGRAVGAGTGKASSLGDALYAMARVVPAHRRRGVGGELIRRLSAHAQERRCGSLVGRVLEDDLESRSFLERRGFSIVSRECPVALDLARIPSARPTPPAGVEIVSLTPGLGREISLSRSYNETAVMQERRKARPHRISRDATGRPPSGAVEFGELKWVSQWWCWAPSGATKARARSSIC